MRCKVASRPSNQAPIPTTRTSATTRPAMDQPTIFAIRRVRDGETGSGTFCPFGPFGPFGIWSIRS